MDNIDTTKYLVSKTIEYPKKCLEMIFERLYNSQAGEDNPFSPLLVDELCGDSPIEKIFYLAFLFNCFDKNVLISLLPQWCIETENNSYRVDFLYNPELDGLGSKTKIVIECDGHEYHHRNSEQVSRDYRRDLDLKKLGYEVIRFSGSQIFNNPYDCANEVIEYILCKDGELYGI